MYSLIHIKWILGAFAPFCKPCGKHFKTIFAAFMQREVSETFADNFKNQINS